MHMYSGQAGQLKFESSYVYQLISWLFIKHKQVYFGVSFVKQTINKRQALHMQ